ncbi:pyridoxal-phosphate dependent enzyme [Demequina sp.]|uniref:threonine ammonia-lyase n=1 Tax=Demequina sp. TaxID=2050685 RepID=UPI0025BA4497|nr:pyridoxal-phosphate dependent enzyme [Demequina sp.]
MEKLTVDGVYAAAERLRDLLPPTPAWSYPVLDAAVGSRAIVKHENVQPTGAFKVRGGLNLLATLSPAERAAGLITVSTGNHAQSLAYAAGRAGVAATIVMPRSTPFGKAQAVRAWGARALLEGSDMAQAADFAVSLAAREGLHFVNPGNTPAIVYGHGTVYLELLQSHPEIETLYVPVGSGSGLAGALLVRDALAPSVRVVGVQAESASAAYDSWRAGAVVAVEAHTFAAGLATGTGFELPQSIMRERLDDFLLVSDDDLRHAMSLMATAAHTLCEGAGAAGLAGALADASRPGVVGFACTGGNACASEMAGLGRVAVGV